MFGDLKRSDMQLLQYLAPFLSCQERHDVNLLIDDSTILDEIDDAGWHDQFNGNESGDHWAWGVEFLRRHGARYSDELM